MPGREWITLYRAPNPGPMTLDGTNTWVLRGPGATASVVVDPGPADPGHLGAVAASGPVEAIVLTHGHPDHSEGVDQLRKLAGGDVRVYAVNATHCRAAAPLRAGQVLSLAGVKIAVVATPGHTSDSVCLLASHGDERVMLTGDTILGRGTTIVAWPDGDLGDYLASLDVLSGFAGVPVLPGHGPELPDCGEIARAYRAHRDERLVQVRAALAAGARTPAEVVVHVYPDLEPALVPAAEWTVRAALAHLGPPPGVAT